MYVLVINLCRLKFIDLSRCVLFPIPTICHKSIIKMKILRITTHPILNGATKNIMSIIA